MIYAQRIGFILLLLLPLGNTLVANEYIVAVRAHKGIAAAHEIWQPTVDVLNNNTANNIFTLLPIISLEEITKQAGNREFDFLLTNPSSYVEVNKLFSARALVTLNNKRSDTAQSRFGSVIFTHALNVDIATINDLQGKTLMAVSEPAFGGWRVAWLEMLEQGFDPYVGLSKLLFTNSQAQPEVVFAVRDRKVDVGVVRTDLLERMEIAGKIDMRYFRIINNKNISDFPFFLSTKLYPEWAFAALKHIPTNVSEWVTKQLLAINQKSPAAILGQYVGWIKPRDYSEVDKLMLSLKVGPYASKNKSNYKVAK